MTSKKWIYTGWILSLFLIIGCKSKNAIPKVADDVVKYQLKKGVCFGQCPVYELNIYEGGLAEFYGERFTDKKGTFKKQLSEEQFKEIEQAFVDAEFFELEGDYGMDLVDLPTVSISHNNGKMEKSVAGKSQFPSEFIKLNNLLTEVAESGGWHAIQVQPIASDEADNRDASDQIIKDEVIIEPAEDLFLPIWIKDRSSYGVRLIKRVSPGVNLFVIGFDKNRISPDKFLKMLQADKDIVKAEFNKRVRLRN